MTKELIEIVQYHIDNKMILNIERQEISDVSITGFPIILTNDYLLMTNIYDFHDEGYVMVRTCDITDAYFNDDESFYESICIQEGLQNKISQCHTNDLANIKSFLEIISKERYVTFHCEKEIEKCNFFMGKVEHITNDYVELLFLGADGKWDEKTDLIYFSDITMISFDDHYSKMFYKYAENK